MTDYDTSKFQIISDYMRPAPTLGAYVCVLDGEANELPYLACIDSLLPLCDEVVVLDGESTDNTWQVLNERYSDNSKVTLLQSRYDKTIPAMDGAQKQLARMACKSNFLIQMDADEVLHESGYDLIRKHVREWKEDQLILCYAQIEPFACTLSANTMNHCWKWRLSLNLPWLGHGIQRDQRKRNEKGQTYSTTTDGCEMIDFRTGDWAPSHNFYNSELEQMRRETPWLYARACNEIIFRNVPTIWHASWMFVPRKLKMVKRFWQDQWETLRQGPSGENKTWKHDPRTSTPEQDAEMIKDIEENGLPAFGSFAKFKVEQQPPAVMRDWLVKMKEQYGDRD